MDKANEQQMKKSLVWDCGSSLYDSFELKSFERQLDSAILSSSRSLSMPHLTTSHSDNHLPPRLQHLPRPNKGSSSFSSSPSKISRSLHKFVRLVFRSKATAGTLSRQVKQGRSHSQNDVLYDLYDRSGSASSSGGLSTIPEVPEVDFDSLPRRTASLRFTPSTRLGISCA